MYCKGAQQVKSSKIKNQKSKIKNQKSEVLIRPNRETVGVRKADWFPELSCDGSVSKIDRQFPVQKFSTQTAVPVLALKRVKQAPVVPYRQNPRGVCNSRKTTPIYNSWMLAGSPAGTVSRL